MIRARRVSSQKQHDAASFGAEFFAGVEKPLGGSRTKRHDLLSAGVRLTRSLPQAVSQSSLVAQDQSVPANRPAILLVHKKRVEILFRGAFLFDPRATAVARTQDDAAASNDPTIAFAHKLHTQQN